MVDYDIRRIETPLSYPSTQDPAKIVMSVDESLHHLSNLVPLEWSAPRPVFKVQDEQGIYVLKLGFDSKAVYEEYQRTVKAQGIEGIPKLVRVYEYEGGVGFMKRFIDGKHLSGKIGDDKKTKLEQTVQELHDRGIFGLDLSTYSNFVETSELIFLIDLGPSDVTWIEEKFFDYHVEVDRMKLQHILGRK